MTAGINANNYYHHEMDASIVLKCIFDAAFLACFNETAIEPNCLSKIG